MQESIFRDAVRVPRLDFKDAQFLQGLGAAEKCSRFYEHNVGFDYWVILQRCRFCWTDGICKRWFVDEFFHHLIATHDVHRAGKQLYNKRGYNQLCFLLAAGIWARGSHVLSKKLVSVAGYGDHKLAILKLLLAAGASPQYDQCALNNAIVPG